MKVSGVIDSITSKTVSNGGTVYTAHIDGTEVNLGFSCNYKEGEYVEIEAEQTKWGLQVPRRTRGSNASTGRGVSDTAQSRPSNVGSGATSRNQSAKESSGLSTNESIVRQNALTNANSAVSHAINSKVFKPTSKEEVYNEIIEVAYNLKGFALGTMDKKLVQEAQLNQARDVAAEAETSDA